VNEWVKVCEIGGRCWGSAREQMFLCRKRERERNIEKEKERLPLLLLKNKYFKNKINIKILTIVTH